MSSYIDVLNPIDFRIRQLHRSDESINRLLDWLKDLILLSDDESFTQRVNRIRSALVPVVRSIREEVLIQEGTQTDIVSKLDELPDQVRKVMRFNLVYEMPFHEVSKRLNITLDEAYSLYYTGTNLLFGVNDTNEGDQK